MPTLYKICPAALWREAERQGVFRGSALDLRDGFIHFSTAEQVKETAAKHFAGQRDLLLIAVDAARLGAALKWEPRAAAPGSHIFMANSISQRSRALRRCRSDSMGATSFRAWSAERSRRSSFVVAQQIPRSPLTCR